MYNSDNLGVYVCAILQTTPHPGPKTCWSSSGEATPVYRATRTSRRTASISSPRVVASDPVRRAPQLLAQPRAGDFPAKSNFSFFQSHTNSRRNFLSPCSRLSSWRREMSTAVAAQRKNGSAPSASDAAPTAQSRTLGRGDGWKLLRSWSWCGVSTAAMFLRTRWGVNSGRGANDGTFLH